MKRIHRKRGTRSGAFIKRFEYHFDRFQEKYRSLLEWALAHRAW